MIVKIFTSGIKLAGIETIGYHAGLFFAEAAIAQWQIKQTPIAASAKHAISGALGFASRPQSPDQ